MANGARYKRDTVLATKPRTRKRLNEKEKEQNMYRGIFYEFSNQLFNLAVKLFKWSINKWQILLYIFFSILHKKLLPFAVILIDSVIVSIQRYKAWHPLTCDKYVYHNVITIYISTWQKFHVYLTRVNGKYIDF